MSAMDKKRRLDIAKEGVNIPRETPQMLRNNATLEMRLTEGALNAMFSKSAVVWREV